MSTRHLSSLSLSLSFSSYEEYKWKHFKYPIHKKYSKKEGHLG
jgi:hypothetical protein